MSNVVTRQCWPLQMPPTAKAVLMSLAENANDAGECWPSISTIVERTCFGKTAVIDAIKWLEDRRLLLADRTNGRHTRYRVTPSEFNQSATQTSPPADPVREADQSASRTSPPAERDPSASRSAPVRQADTNRQEPPRTGRAKKQPPALTFVPPDWIPAAAWFGYLEMRRKKRAHPTDRACELVVAELQKLWHLGHKPEDVLDQSTRNNWTDVYAVKPGATDANRQPGRKLSVVEQVEQHIADRERNRDGGFVLEGEAVRVAAR